MTKQSSATGRTAGQNLLKVLLFSIAGLVGLHIFWHLVAFIVGADNRVTTDLAGRFGLDDELSVPTWFASAMALLLAGLAFVIARAQQPRQRLTWYILASVAVFISLDEVAALHELLLQGLHILFEFGEDQTLLANAWMIVLPFILVVLFCLIRAFRKTLPSKTFQCITIAFGVYLLGALVVEYLSIELDKTTIAYGVSAALEETLEMLGLWLLIRAALLHIRDFEPNLRSKLSGLLGQ